ncbi:MAG TPA: alpha/beta hydrolase [Candidatus Binatia bacterium]|nr:alpha/beta hydrolase [Candidatus Binatia bacterium]
MDATTFHSRRRFTKTPSGRIAWVDHGAGPPAVFVHGVPLNGFHWRHVMERVGDLRRCIAPDLMGLGYTEIAADQDVSFTAQARMLAELCDALDLGQIDLVGNDSGGGIAQLFAARYPERLRSLTLTNCDTHDNWPPAGVLPIIEAARGGMLADASRMMLADPAMARSEAGLGVGYADPSALTDEAIRVYLEPLLSTPERIANMHRYWTSFDCAQTVAIEPALRALRVPALVVWALADPFFPVRWAHWLRDTIPGVVRVVEVPEAKLFFPEDRPDALAAPLRELWTTVRQPSTEGGRR